MKDLIQVGTLYKMADSELIRELAKTTNGGYAISEAHKRMRMELIVNLLHRSES